MALREKRWDEAIGRLSQRIASDPQNDWLRYYLGNVYWWTDRERAIEWYEEAARGFSARGEASAELMARGNIRALLMQEGRPEEAALQIAHIAAAAQSSTDPEVQARSYILQGRHLWQTSQDLAKADRFLRAAERLLFPTGLYDLKTDCLLLLGNVTLELGELERSIEYNRRLESLVTERDDPMTLAPVLHNIANAMRLQLEESPRDGAREEAIGLARKALATAELAGHREVQIMSHRLLGALLTSDVQREDEAAAHFERCLELAEGFDLRQERGNCHWEYARLLYRHDTARADRFADEALRIALEFGDPVYIAFAWRQKMRGAWTASADPKKSIRESMEALEAVEKLRELQLGEETRAGLFSKWTADYYFVSGQLLRRKELSAAFTVAERMRARTLREAVSWTEPAELTEVREQLSQTQAVLAFQVGLWENLYGEFGGGAWVLVLTADGAQALPLPDRSRLGPAVDGLVGLVQRRDGSENVFAERLYKLVLKNALDVLPSRIDELMIVPDDILYRLPFGTLRDPETGQFLSSRFRISMIPSATLWLRWARRESRTLQPAALVFADPRAEAVRPGDPAQGRESPLIAKPPGTLPFARREGRSIARSFGGRGELLLDDEAREGRLKGAELDRYSIIHFAAHAIVDERYPFRSAIMLASEREDEDGWLKLPEIARLDLDGQLIGLSACQTADGGLLRGEGVLSLARGFFQAGARTIVASLWPLRDKEAFWLFDSFYRRIAEGKTASAALQDTQNDAMRRGMPAAAWGSLVLMGDGSTMPVPGGVDAGPRWSYQWTILMCIVVAALTIAWRRTLHRFFWCVRE